MNKILNPFEYLSSGKALWWGLAGTVLSIILICLSRLPFEFSPVVMLSILSTNLGLWLSLSLLLYVAALIFSPSRIRALDVFALNLFALLPFILVDGISNPLFKMIQQVEVEPLTTSWLAVYGFYYLMRLVASISLVWSMVWGCMAFRVSANIKEARGVVIFLIDFVIVNLAIQLIITYYSW